MKSAPYFVAAFTASAALAGSLLLAAQDRELFDPEHALVLVDQAGTAWGLAEPARAAPARERDWPTVRRTPQASSAAMERH